MSKPSFPKWNNPYIDKVETLPDLLAPCFGGRVSDDEKKNLDEKMSLFRKLVVEFGCGSGRHLSWCASQDPDTLFVGFELRYKRAFRSAEKALKGNLKNVFVLRTNVSVIAQLFQPAALEGVFVNFPDPWEKKRWEGNLMLNAVMLETLRRLLKPGGFLSYKTDHVNRFRQVCSSLKSSSAFDIVEESENFQPEGDVGERSTTEFEGLFRSKGLPICYLLARTRLTS